MFCRAARARGLSVVAVALTDFTSPLIEDEADEVHWVSLSELAKIGPLLSGAGASRAVMLGKVPQAEVFSGRSRDRETQAALSSAANMQTQAILQAGAAMLALSGVTLLDSRTHMEEHLAQPGALTARSPSAEERADIEYGVSVARQLGAADIGQTVVVKSRAVLAVEAIEGTDACIRRGSSLCDGGAVVVKIAKPDQDMRFDVPVIGPATARVLAEGKAAAMAVQCGATFVVERAELASLADAAGVSIVAVEVTDE